METRTPTQVDAETLATLASEVFAEAYASAFPSAQALRSHVQAVFTPKAFEEELKVSSVWYSLGLTQGVPAGFIKMEKSKPLLPLGDDVTTVELSKLYVLSRFHGSGMADQLMAEGLGYTNAQNLSIVWLCVWEQNPRANLLSAVGIQHRRRSDYSAKRSSLSRLGDEPGVEEVRKLRLT